ncbi:MAG TPA: acyl-CoA dehydrogenase family protein, partial [Pyrinomonadaceae bacterium]
MYPPAQYAAAERLEAYLGDPFDPESSLSFKRLLQLDEAELYPEDACRLLNHWHLHLYYIPIEEGGQLSSYEEVLSLIRAIARRDITCAIAHAKTYLGAAALWLAGTEKQKQR